MTSRRSRRRPASVAVNVVRNDVLCLERRGGRAGCSIFLPLRMMSREAMGVLGSPDIRARIEAPSQVAGYPDARRCIFKRG